MSCHYLCATTFSISILHYNHNHASAELQSQSGACSTYRIVMMTIQRYNGVVGLLHAKVIIWCQLLLTPLVLFSPPRTPPKKYGSIPSPLVSLGSSLLRRERQQEEQGSPICFTCRDPSSSFRTALFYLEPRTLFHYCFVFTDTTMKSTDFCIAAVLIPCLSFPFFLMAM